MGAKPLIVTFMSGAEDGRQIEVSGPAISIGREEHNDVIVPFDSRVSRRHARVERDGDQFCITDLKSRNGTYLEDGTRVTETIAIAPGTLFRLGRTWLKVDWAG